VNILRERVTDTHRAKKKTFGRFDAAPDPAGGRRNAADVPGGCAAAGGVPLHPLRIDLLVLVAWLAVCAVLAVRFFRWE
jgi:hypothetical protein